MKSIIIFSVWHKDQPLRINRTNHEFAKRHLTAGGIDYQVGGRLFEGFQEPVFILVDTIKNRLAAHIIAGVYLQDSILIVDSDGMMTLETPEGEFIERLGSFRNVPESVAVKRGAWTRIDGQFYVATPAF